MLTTVTLTLLEGLVTTLELFVLTLVFALPLGLIISFGSMSRFAPLRGFVKTVVWIIRGTPLMLQILVIFYGPGLLFGLPLLPRFTAALASFVINYACYFSEIYRGGIQAVPRGQYEAGQVLGMTKGQIFFKVTLLQMVKRIVPPMSNEIITLVKDTSLSRIIALQEIIWAGQAFLKGSQGISGAIWPLLFTPSVSRITTLLFALLSLRRFTAVASPLPMAVPSSIMPLRTPPSRFSSDRLSVVSGH